MIDLIKKLIASIQNISNEIIEKIIEMFGGININKIIIPENYNRPSQLKLSNKKLFYIKNDYFQDNVIIDENNKLIDGFSSYYIAKLWEFKHIKVTKIKLKNK